MTRVFCVVIIMGMTRGVKHTLRRVLVGGVFLAINMVMTRGVYTGCPETHPEDFRGRFLD
jgi:hypothetical protein